MRAWFSGFQGLGFRVKGLGGGLSLVFRVSGFRVDPLRAIQRRGSWVCELAGFSGLGFSAVGFRV